MKPGKILKIFKKGAKAAPRKKGKAAAGAYKWPSGIRIGVCGHSNSGKTVYLTTVYKESEVSKKLQVSVTDSKTANEFLANWKEISGIDTSRRDGTVVDLRGEQKFPDPTEGDRILQFNAVLDRSKKLSVVTYDYDGNAVSISDTSELKDKLLDFVEGANGIIFLYDPKLLGAELESQAHVASFVTVLEQLAPLSSRLPVPVTLVVTKADILPGFSGEGQTVLVAPEDEQFFSEDFELFLEKVLSSNRIASNSEWAGSVRNVLVRLKDFLKVVLGRTLDFQIFFVSNTGQTPEKIGTDVGRSIYRPPRIIRPVGVQEPLYWILTSVVRSRRISKFRKFAKYVALLSLIWMVVCSIPFAYHFMYLLPQATRVEDSILESHSGSMVNVSAKEKGDIYRAYEGYSRKWLVRQVFPKFRPHSQAIAAAYYGLDIKDAEKRLDNAIGRFARVAADTNMWPKYSPSDSKVLLGPEHEQFVSTFETFLGDSNSPLFPRSDRTLDLWGLFEKLIEDPADSTRLSDLVTEVNTIKSVHSQDLSDAENGLLDALLAIKMAKEEKQVEEQTVSKLDELVKEINKRSNQTPEYRFGTAVEKLEEFLRESPSGSGVDKVNAYLREVEKWKTQRRKFDYQVVAVADDGILYIEVTEDGEEPKWKAFGQIIEGEEYTVEWKIDDDIHIAFCEPGRDCQRGASPSGKIILDQPYSLFQMDEDLHFTGINKDVKLRFKSRPEDLLPELK